MQLWDKIGWHGMNRMIGLVIDPNGGPHYWVLCKRKNSEVRTLVTHTASNYQVLLEQLSSWPGVPIALFLTGQAPVEMAVEASQEDVIAAVLGVKVESKKAFLIQEFPLQSGARWVALLRKESLETVLTHLQPLQSQLVYINISPVVASFLIPGLVGYTPERPYQLLLENNMYSWQGGLQPAVLPDAWPVSVEDLSRAARVPETHLMGYASVFHYYLSSGKDMKSLITVSEQAQTLKKKLQVLRAAGFTLLVMALLILGGILTSFVLDQRILQTQQLLAQRRAILRQIDQNKQRIQEQRAFLQDQHSEGVMNSQVSLHIDRIAAQVPQALSLDELSVLPTEKVLKDVGRELLDAPPDMVIKGIATETAAIATYSEAVQELEFVEVAELYRSEYDFQREVHDFVLLVYLGNEKT